MKDEEAQAETLMGQPDDLLRSLPAPRPGEALLGKLVDQRYRILGLLGQGGMGLVYHAKHEVLGTPLALKVLRAEASSDTEAMERLKREAQSASAIGNEHIVDVRDFGKLADGSTYVVMELLEGVDLFRTVREGALPWKRSVRIALQICEALGAAHERGIVHRDLKPENVLLVERRGDPDFVKILDFGIAKVQDASIKLTAAGRVMGTPEYMSPEQCAGRPLDHRTDLYALGVMLYEMVTARLPFADKDLLRLVKKQIQDPPKSPSSVRPDLEIPLPLEAVILRCLAKRPDQRYSSMEALGDALRAVEGGQALPETEELPPPVEAVSSFSPPAPISEPRPTPAARQSDRSPWRTLGLIGAIVGVVGLAAGFWLMREPPAHPVVVARPPQSVPAPPAPTTPEVPAAPAPAVEPTVAVPSEPAQSAQIQVQTEPPGAQVRVGEQLVGLTPIAIERPASGELTTLVIEMQGYRTRDVVLSPMTADLLRVALERAPHHVARPIAGQEPVTGGALPPAPQPPTPAGPHREWRDPWSDPH